MYLKLKTPENRRKSDFKKSPKIAKNRAGIIRARFLPFNPQKLVILRAYYRLLRGEK
jgi:hypothetical protein